MDSSIKTDGSVSIDSISQELALKGLSEVKTLDYKKLDLEGNEEDNEIKKVAMPVIQTIRVEYLNKLAKKAQGKDLLPGEEAALKKYEKVVNSAVESKWMTWTEVNEKAIEKGLIDDPKVVNEAKDLVQEAQSILSTINLEDESQILDNKQKLLPIKTSLESVAKKLNKGWEELVRSLNGSQQLIRALQTV